MSDENQTPKTRLTFRTHPGMMPTSKPTVGRSIWYGTTRVFSLMGSAFRPFAEAWNLAGGPGGQGGVVLANFMQKFGDPRVQHMNERVYVPRVDSDANSQAQNFNLIGNEVRISSEVSDSIEQVMATRYDAMVSSSSEIKND